ncbi:growth factor receptor-bound protein 2 [Salpingoeca rosetta]|uniref:Growth factor receptor-bound protein 2 n=1 Tax=Salpingoeca rosetta (strain ATCC 50818 / BSB-021) TaxID=946362 RepID=F2U6Q4_SALR5|nr:growth factor receptor-bound protein 2 [Salpingoeca rosetta]EGD83536.1 growth factor receptor-bound protein 2 [Salpingoeca rosetta]|eukprot:XP_004995040.1 growth factor receptor-bound protein 2 [Salpingoeca rosetta]
MEARALHDFAATQKDELSFSKGSIVKVINIDEDKNWFKAELDGKTGYIPANYVQMEPHGWFHGRISREDSERILMGARDDGAFLFRESWSTPGQVNNQQGVHVQHFKILRDDVGKYFLWVTKFNSLNELINYHKTSSVSRAEEIFLTTAIGRDGQPANMPAATAARVSQREAAAPVAQVRAPAPAPAPMPVAPPAQANPGETIVTAQYTFKPQESGELGFTKGEQIVVLDKSDEHWWKGRCRGEVGLFPAAYVA